MGLIYNELITTYSGIEKSGAYISLNNEQIYMRKVPSAVTMPPTSSLPITPEPTSSVVLPPSSEPTPTSTSPMYQVSANYRIFWDKNARDANKSYIEIRSIQTTITEEELQKSLYTILYEKLKELYPNSVDA